MVGSVTRNARAISAVVSPASVRSVSATRASSGSAGWQQVKISRSRSSAMSAVVVVGSGFVLRRRQQRRLLELGGLDRAAAQPVERAVAGHRGEPRARARAGRRRAARRSAPARTRPGRTPRRGPSRRSSRSAWRRPGPTPARNASATAARTCRRLIPARTAAPRSCRTWPPGAWPRPRCASSRSAHSMMSKPAICSLVSANGPSASSTSPSRTRTVVASLTGRQLVADQPHPAGVHLVDPGLGRRDRICARFLGAERAEPSVQTSIMYFTFPPLP